MPKHVKAELFDMAIMGLWIIGSYLSGNLLTEKQYVLAVCLLSAVTVAFCRVIFGLGKGGANAKA